jgi:biopolymer transport protein ExbB
MILSHWLDPVFITIFVLSITGLTLIIQGFIKNRESILLPAPTIALMRDMIAQRRFKDLLDFTETDPSFMSKALNPALKRAPVFSNMKEAMETAIGEQTAEQFRRIEYLNIIGNLGPLLGLLGTVLGMIQAFSEMQASGGNASPAQLAGGISTALTHTFLGLALAVPCLACFGVLRTMVDRLTVRGALVCEDLLLMIRPAEPRPVVAQPQVMPQQQGVPQAEMRSVPEPLLSPPGATIQMSTPPPPPSLSRKPSPSAYPQGGL